MPRSITASGVTIRTLVKTVSLVTASFTRRPDAHRRHLDHLVGEAVRSALSWKTPIIAVPCRLQLQDQGYRLPGGGRVQGRGGLVQEKQSRGCAMTAWMMLILCFSPPENVEGNMSQSERGYRKRDPGAPAPARLVSAGKAPRHHAVGDGVQSRHPGDDGKELRDVADLLPAQPQDDVLIGGGQVPGLGPARPCTRCCPWREDRCGRGISAGRTCRSRWDR